MSPGAHQRRPGSITVMNDDNVSERVVVLAQQALDLLRFIKDAPPSPFKTFLPAKRRRVLRREAARLREGKAEPRYKNLHTPEELAALYEQTALRDEILEQGVRQIQWIARDFGRIRKEHPAELQTAMEAFVREAHQSAEQHGPGSEAARRYETLLYLAGLGQQLGQQRHSHRRRQRAPVPRRIDLAPDPSIEKLYAQTAAELLTSPPSSDDVVIAIPPHG